MSTRTTRTRNKGSRRNDTRWRPSTTRCSASPVSRKLRISAFVPWLVYMCAVTHDIVSWLVTLCHSCDMTQSWDVVLMHTYDIMALTHDIVSFVACADACLFVCHDSCIGVCHDSCTCVCYYSWCCTMRMSVRLPWVIYGCTLTRSHVCHDSFICVSWFIHAGAMTYI